MQYDAVGEERGSTRVVLIVRQVAPRRHLLQISDVVAYVLWLWHDAAEADVKPPLYYYCPGCQNPSSPAGALDRFTLVGEMPDGKIVVDCLDCGVRSESYHRDLRGKMPRKYAKRTEIMMAADFALDAEIRKYNSGNQERDGTGVTARAGLDHPSPTTDPGCQPSVRPSSSAAEQRPCKPKCAGSSPVSGSKRREKQAEMFD